MVREIHYDPVRRVGTVYMAPHTCTDMTGAITFFERIDPAVQRIETVAGEFLDTGYTRQPDGSWVSRSFHRLQVRVVGRAPDGELLCRQDHPQEPEKSA